MHKELGFTEIRTIPKHKMTMEKCVKACKNANKKYASLKAPGLCFCGNHYNILRKFAAKNSECTTKCLGDSRQFCGGNNRSSLFTIGMNLKNFQT